MARLVAGIAKSKILLPNSFAIRPEREPAAEDAEEPLEGRIPDGARQAEGQLAARGKGTEEEQPGIY